MKNRFSFINSKMKKAGAVVAGVGSAIMAGTAQAQLDVAPLATEIEGGSAHVQTIGLAVLGVVATVCLLKLIRRAF